MKDYLAKDLVRLFQDLALIYPKILGKIPGNILNKTLGKIFDKIPGTKSFGKTRFPGQRSLLVLQDLRRYRTRTSCKVLQDLAKNIGKILQDLRRSVNSIVPGLSYFYLSNNSKANVSCLQLTSFSWVVNKIFD